ncbi:uncharacterized protein LOC119676369 [Teleopsis dalmanni]|uniref:uncharacterized protein LOC119676369 n=1 Tax=Teleopsis dalmanni TaxID=139649 RepID=UPI0018CC8991|nr:uncharacterized protein LOC119676369 [Teleopsis dalmanni]XP_037943543.1 uncharacterized protein LOC119676369 [Teleopsis dalmanni]
MSRFKLRSNTEGFQFFEENVSKSASTNKSSKGCFKKMYQKNNKLTFDKGENSKELVSKNFGINSIVCKVPLCRISSVIERLKLSRSFTSISKNNDCQYIQAKIDNTYKSNSNKKVHERANRNLCLYCNKKFTSYKMQLKHVEKIHIQQKDRRSSCRNSQLPFVSKKVNVNTPILQQSIENFPGCLFCKSGKSHKITTQTNDLNELFKHLTECHADKYFGCKICIIRFPNGGKLSKHMQLMHDKLSKCNDTKSLSDNLTVDEITKLKKTRHKKLQNVLSTDSSKKNISSNSASIDNNIHFDAEEPILSRLGLTQNRLPNNRKGGRLRRENNLANLLLKSDQSTLLSSSSERMKGRSKLVKNSSINDDDVVFRVPTKTDLSSCIFDDDFYKEIVTNVRNNLLYYIDGKIKDTNNVVPETAVVKDTFSHICTTIVKSPIVTNSSADIEIHAATSLSATTAFPTLLTTEQYGSDVTSKFRRPHTKNSWKWKWDSVKKFKFINEGGKIIKKMKQPMHGLRDLSKLDMWTQLTMRQKFEQNTISNNVDNSSLIDSHRVEKQRLNNHLNNILDTRLFPNITLEQNEQAIVKIEHLSDTDSRFGTDGNRDNLLDESFTDHDFLTMLQLTPRKKDFISQPQLLLSGECVRPRCYLCMCCGAKFEKLKSLEEHKLYRHALIFATHYEVVGRDLVQDNLLRHLFIPKQALSYYATDNNYSINLSRLNISWAKNDLAMRINTEEESSDSRQSNPNNCIHTSTEKNVCEDCDTDTKTALDISHGSPSQSIHSSNSSYTTPIIKTSDESKNSLATITTCTKCKRKCKRILDLYRHMLDCSGDYVWSMVKKRKYRYYCGSKKRRQCNKYNLSKLRNKKRKKSKNCQTFNDTEESGSNSSKIKTPQRQRPSDAESIKKMLENLPPKRVCKKIFPALNKTIKTRKSKLISKHNMYSNQILRKTRAKQISQATKLLSKTKRQFPRKSTEQKKLLLRLNHKSNVSETAKNKKCREDILQLKPPFDVIEKTTLMKPEDKFITPTIVILTDTDNGGSLKESTNSINSDLGTSKNNDDILSFQKSKTKELYVDEDISLKNERVIICPEKNIEINNVDQTPRTIESTDVMLNVNKKRSKKISDCIAMLTDKLEEKLKTERNVQTKSVKTDLNSKMELQNKYKLPKRKTTCRRIIKPDGLEKVLNIGIQEANTLTLNSTHHTIHKTSEHFLHEKPLSQQLQPVVYDPSKLNKFPNLSNIESKISQALPTLQSLPLFLPVEPVQCNDTKLVSQLQNSNFLQMTAPNSCCSVEPLNLSSSKNLQNLETPTFSNTTAHRIGIPARRQTICGFEARNLILNELEPLDLSIKSKTEKRYTKITDLTSLVASPVSNLPTNGFSTSALTATIPVNTETFSKKLFYSNLELLKIPQVRNLVNKIPIEVQQNTISKPINKKRIVNKIPTFGAEAENDINHICVINKPEHAKEMFLQKKENTNKNKPVQKMDEIVINHIDDAINSVINAVKASFPDNENKVCPIGKSSSKQSSLDLNASKLKEVKEAEPVLLPSKMQLPTRRMRSKTLDCRPTATIIGDETNSNQEKNDFQVAKNLIQCTTKNSDIISDDIPISAENQETIECLKPSTNKKVDKKNSATVNYSAVEDVNVNLLEREKFSNENLNPGENPIISRNDSISSLIPLPFSHTELSQNKTQETTIIKNLELKSTLANSACEENINTNNTSSGFHSCQSEIILDPKKKPRRRRKNELAAIVADQLLESFKIDKTRRDNLKKLEHLAYEKSEDLLLTGMLLMSSTKRNAASVYHPLTSGSNTYKEKSIDLIKRQKQIQSNMFKTKTDEKEDKNKSNLCGQKFDENIVDKITTNKTTDVPKVNISTDTDMDTDGKKVKRRQYRRKAKLLNHANITVLKSSLESFSIDIEQQLTDIEAKTVNSIKTLDSDNINSFVNTGTKHTSILRPSILSATFERANVQNMDNIKKNEKSFKSVISSRDPRLNKNIHKDNKVKPSDMVTKIDICEIEDDNYLTEIAKTVNEKMSDVNQDFFYANDGFELAKELQDDSNSKYYRPPTSMSVRSAPNLNDDRSNFGSICDENTNTEVMDMDLDDDLSVYTSFSQDIGRVRGRKRRRRRSILLKRKPKKRLERGSSGETFICDLCKKTFYSSNSLAKHKTTLAHVSKVSEWEYVLSNNKDRQISEALKPTELEGFADELNSKKSKCSSDSNIQTTIPNKNEKSAKAALMLTVNNAPIVRNDMIDSNKIECDINTNQRLTLNPDERLFFECCNILKGVETSRLNSNDGCNNSSNHSNLHKQKTSHSMLSTTPKSSNLCILPNSNIQQTFCKDDALNSLPRGSSQKHMLNNIAIERKRLSPSYSGLSQFSAVTNNASRFKTKAAMKGYENVNFDLTVQEIESKSHTICKLTELAEIALGSEKSNPTKFNSSGIVDENKSNVKHLSSHLYISTSLGGNQNNSNLVNQSRDHLKNTETQSSTSSKTIMHSSIIKAVIEEQNKLPSSKIIIPDRPFKNIGLEEKESITFQKPKIAPIPLTDDNSVTTVSYSDRDDFDFASMSCDDDTSTLVTVNDKINNINPTESSSSGATENKSLIMGRIFKNASTKSISVNKVKNTVIQKEQLQKTDLNQIFDELRGDYKQKSKNLDKCDQNVICSAPKKKSKNFELYKKSEKIFCTKVKEKPLTVPSYPKSSIKNVNITSRKKKNTNCKSKKYISKLQTELGMSSDEVEKLIDEGQRKSKRRCATKSQKKFVEIWSSDEYEEFLSTKDIIALIEEKEKQEQQKKRKHSLYQSNLNENKDKEVNIAHITENKKKSKRTLNIGEKDVGIKTINKVDKRRYDKSITYTPNKLKNHSVTEMPLAYSEKKRKSTRSNTHKVGDNLNVSKNNNTEQLNQNNVVLSGMLEKKHEKVMAVTIPSLKTPLNNFESKLSKNKPNTNNVSHFEKSVNPTEPKAIAVIPNDKNQMLVKKRIAEEQLKNEDDLYLSDLKKHKNVKSHKSKSGSKKNCNKIKLIKEDNDTLIDSKKKRISENTKLVRKTNDDPNKKKKRKNQQNQSPSRRKRVATENLYYWSSSSDEDFGRINISQNHEQEHDNGEQYRKHGWIVGDSHKKLVTLLAIAKGSKKVVNCGVKKKTPKKKN